MRIYIGEALQLLNTVDEKEQEDIEFILGGNDRHLN